MAETVEPTTEELQRASLDAVFFSGGGQPPPVNEAERSEFSKRLASARGFERRALEEYVSDPDLQVLAVRDTDGDGVRDYRISDYFGKFMEGDIDLDDDGISNSLDAAPYDAKVGGSDEDGDLAPDRGFKDHDSDGIPDHVDWSLTKDQKDEKSAELQAALFREHHVLLVDRSASFSPDMARSASDALTRVFRHRVAEGNLPTLRQIVADETCLLSQDLDDDTNAMVVPQTQTLLVYRIGLDYPPIAQLGLLVHELSHSWQYALDFDADLAVENRRVYDPSPNFNQLVEPFGWSAKAAPYDPAVDDYRLFTPQYEVLGPTYRYQKKTPKQWEAKMRRLEKKRGDGYLEDPVAKGIVGNYSLTSPGEWHADNLLAYFYLTLEEWVTEQDAYQDEEAELVGALREPVQEAWGSEFRYRNFDRERLGDHFEKNFPLTDDDLEYFVEKYLRPEAEKRRLE